MPVAQRPEALPPGELARATPRPAGANAALVLADGTTFWGRGIGAAGQVVGEVCFNTSMTGYQEILTDPSYAGQIITFTFPHIGNVGTNPEDIETVTPAASSCAPTSRSRRTSAPRATSTSGCGRAASLGSPASTPARSPR